jgi:hypothetical protein
LPTLRPRARACSPRSIAILAAVLAALAAPAAPVAALQIDFDDLASGADAAAADLGLVQSGPALVIDEADLGALGFAAAGTWATTGDTGLLNTLAPTITFALAAPVRALSVDVLALADATGAPFPVVLQAWSGGALVDQVVSDPSQVGDSGFPEARLAVAADAGFDEARLFAGQACGPGCLAPGPTTSFFADTLRATPVPEPVAPALLGLALAAATGRPRRRAARGRR